MQVKMKKHNIVLATSKKAKKMNIYKQDAHRLIVVVNNIVVKNSSENI